MSDGKIICAVDFGTTYSGLAYAYVESDQKPDDVSVELIEDHWPGMGAQTSPKVPSVFKFDKTAPGGFKWGFQLDDDPDRICYAKLYLDPNQIAAAQTLATFSTRLGKLPPNRKVTDGISKYLECLRAVAIDQMESEWGKEFVSSTPMESIITVPAVWSDKAKSDTLQCAHRAGFGELNKIKMITEPEAAAVYTFHQLPSFSVKPGDIFITCDAGGGTVDLTTYRVFETEPLLRVDEVTVGSGGLCGSVYLNRKFETLVRDKIGPLLDSLSKSESTNALHEMQQAFNSDIKLNFGLGDISNAIYEVPVPENFEDNDEFGIEYGKLTFTGEEMKQVFDPVIGMIIELINGQLDRVEESLGDVQVSALLLVGGFGGSEYLRMQIENHFSGDDEDIPALTVIQPVNAWSAVTRGAMLRAIQGDIVQTRIIRHHYGIVMREDWDPARHEAPDKRRTAESNKKWSDVQQKYSCHNIMRWYVHKGDKFSSKKVVTFNFYQAITDFSNMIFSFGLIIFTGSGEPSFFHTSECKTVATLKADLSSIAHSEFQRVNSGNGDWYKVSFDIEMSFEATLSFSMIFKGKRMGECAVDYGQL